MRELRNPPWTFSCVSSKGNSGGPLFVYAADGQPVVLGVLFAGEGSIMKFTDFEGGSAIVPLFPFAADILQALKADPC
jgi:hypothetical protein